MYSLFIDLREEIQIVCTEMGKVFMIFLTELGENGFTEVWHPSCRYVGM